MVTDICVFRWPYWMELAILKQHILSGAGLKMGIWVYTCFLYVKDYYSPHAIKYLLLRVRIYGMASYMSSVNIILIPSLLKKTCPSQLVKYS